MASTPAAAACRAAHAVREIACWGRWPSGFTAAEVRAAFDLLAAMERVAVEEGGSGRVVAISYGLTAISVEEDLL